MIVRSWNIYLIAALLSASCSSGLKNIEPAMQSITEEGLKSHIAVLASDDFLGRAPSTLGEEKTINYLAEQFRKIGLKPGNGESYFQEVSLMKITPEQPMKLIVSKGNQKISFAYPDEFAGGTPQVTDNVKFDNSEMIFVGYGINSPEEKWNDYEGLDVKGKTVIMLINDPGYVTSDSTLFEGKAMTYEGRWTYKFEEAARQGAKAAIIIHETGAAAYPWSVVENGWRDSKLYLTDNLLSKSQLLLQSWISTECAKKLFNFAGLDFEKVTSSASRRGFKPIRMDLTASIQFKNRVEYVKSSNVVALWPGKGKSDECLIYSAHWDHFGINPSFNGDSILNGAVDNATGVAALLELAEAFTKLPRRQGKSILFLSSTCEEQGLLGSEYYTMHPIFPLAKTVGVINMDCLNILGKTKDMTITGLGKSTLDKYALDVLKRHGRYASADPTPEKGWYFRSDHFSFAKAGVPVLYPTKGYDNVIHGKGWGLNQWDRWIMENYHKPSDNYEPEKCSLDGMVDDVRAIFEMGYDML